MGLTKLLLIALLAGAGYALYRRFKPERPRPRPLQPYRETARCARCGVHVPAEEAIRDGSEPFCCTEHRRLGRGTD